MLAEDAAWSMPPAATWYRGERLPDFLRVGPLSGAWRWRHVPAHVNGQLAVGVYAWDEAAGTHLPFALDVITLQGDRIAEVTAFIVRTTDLPDRNIVPFSERLVQHKVEHPYDELVQLIGSETASVLSTARRAAEMSPMSHCDTNCHAFSPAHRSPRRRRWCITRRRSSPTGVSRG